MKSLWLYVAVFVLRYLDLFSLHRVGTAYATFMKVAYVLVSVASAALVTFVRDWSTAYKAYTKGVDDFLLPRIVVPCFLAAAVMRVAFSLGFGTWNWCLSIVGMCTAQGHQFCQIVLQASEVRDAIRDMVRRLT